MIFTITTYYSSDRIEKNMLGGACDKNCWVGRGGEYRVLVWQPEGKKLGRLRHGWEDDIKMYLRDI
jgi:hypothetical protein